MKGNRNRPVNKIQLMIKVSFLNIMKYYILYCDLIKIVELQVNINVIISAETDCFQIEFSKQPLPRVALASFPGSGNTWTRHLIQQVSGTNSLIWTHINDKAIVLKSLFS